MYIIAGMNDMKTLPKDPVILLSFINTQLRDFYPSLEELCRDYRVDIHNITGILKSIDYQYNRDLNQFK